jgi:hypothetical protein
VIRSRIRLTNTSFSIEGAKSQSATAGPTVRWIEAADCATPLVAPRERLLGVAELMYINSAPGRSVPVVITYCNPSQNAQRHDLQENYQLAPWHSAN